MCTAEQQLIVIASEHATALGQYVLGHMDYTLLVRCIALNVYSFVACTCPLLSIHISEKLAPSRVPEETHARKYLVLQGSLFQD